MPNYVATSDYLPIPGNNPMKDVEDRLDAIAAILSQSILNTNTASLYPASIASINTLPAGVTLSSLTSSITTGSLVFSGSGTNVRLYVFTGAGTSIPGHAGWVSASLSA
jgi:hypothetical protein